MKYVTVLNGVVDVVYLCPPPEGIEMVEAPDDVFPGWLYLDGKFTAPEEVPAPVVFPPLSARQLRLCLLKIGIKPSQVDEAIAVLPEDQREAASIEWTYASEYQRDHYLIGLLAASFGLTDAQVDDAWKEAETL